MSFETLTDMETKLAADLQHTLKLVPSSQRELFISELARYMVGELQVQSEATARAYGDCKSCYGKGYATYKTAHTGHDTDTDIGSPGGHYHRDVFEVRYCVCHRGVQLRNLAAKGLLT